MTVDALKDLVSDIEATQVIIFAGGRAKRFGHTDTPKPLLPLGNGTLLDYQIDLFRSSGFRRFVFLLGHLGEMIVTHLQEHHDDLDYTVSFDPKVRNVGKGKALKHAISTRAIDVRRRGVIAFPDDVFMDQTLPYRLLAHHLFGTRTLGAKVTILLVSGRNYPFGVVRDIDASGRAKDFEEKPFIPLPTSTGMCVVEPEFYRMVRKMVNTRDRESVEFETTVFPEVARRSMMNVMLIPHEIWYSINDVKEYERVIATLKHRARMNKKQ